MKLAQEEKAKFLNSARLYKIMRQILLRENAILHNKEHLWIVGLSNSNKIIFIELISIVELINTSIDNRLQVNPSEIFRMAVHKLAVKAILVHNHTDGILVPSPTDINFTSRMMKIGRLLNIEIIDHLIISETGYLSFDEKGIMCELKESTLEMAKVFNVQINSDAAIKDSNLKIVKKMKEKGYSTEVIEELTCLSKKEISKV